MASVAERTMGATEFKAKCLQIADELASGALASVTVTKRGKPVMIARPAVPPDRSRAFGMLKHRLTPAEAGALVEEASKPLYTDEEVDRAERLMVLRTERMLRAGPGDK